MGHGIKALSIILCQVTVLLFSVTSCCAVNPGFRTAITSKGLDYIKQVGIPLLEQQLKSIKIPDISGSASITVGKVDYKISDIHLNSLSLPVSSLTSGSTGLTLAVSGASLSMSAHWSYKLKILFPIKDSGTCDASASGLSLKISVIVGADSKGHATLSTTACTFDIGKLNIKFHGGASWLYNLFNGFIEDKLKGLLKDEVCSQAKDFINKEGNMELESLPVAVTLDKVSEINYALLKAPNFTANYVESEHKGEFFSVTDPQEAPFSPTPLPPLTAADKMMYIWLTDYVANTAALVYQKAGYLYYKVTPDMVPPNKFFKLNTKYFQAFIPQLYQKYPDRNITIVVNGTQPPVVKITSGGANFTLPGHLSFYVTINDSHSELAFVLGAVAIIDVTPSLENDGGKQLIKVKATYLSAKLSLVSTNIGNFDVQALQTIFDILSKTVLIKELNKYGSKGLPLPMVDGISLVNPNITLGQDYALIATDINYKPMIV